MPLLRALLFLLASHLSAQESTPLQRPPKELLTIENPTLRIGIDKAMGASITHLSWSENDHKNTINSTDPGRLIQQSYYAGKRLDRQADGQHKAWSPWSWNPIQGGGVGSWARVTTFTKDIKANTLFAETVPKLWDMHDEEAEALMRQWTAFEPDMPNVVVVKNELVCSRQPNDRWGPAHRSPQEVPACYFTRNFDTFKTYQGDGNWQTVTQPIGPPWGVTTSPRNAMAAFSANGQGIAIFSPDAKSWNFGPHGAGKTQDPAAGPCTHIAPVAFVNLGPQSTLSYRYWLIVGTQDEITTRLDELWKKYRSEKISLTNPK
ncbi:MAG: hypothetical protein ACSHYF_00120 [Verrucomicrobiaceae bacterium]